MPFLVIALNSHNRHNAPIKHKESQMTQKDFIQYIQDKYDRLSLHRAEAASEIPCSVNGLINFTKDGAIKGFKVGNRTMYRAADLAEYMGYE